MARPFKSLPMSFAAALLAVAALAFLPLASCGRKAPAPPEPAAGAGPPAAAADRQRDDSVELGFLDALSQHHLQAIELATAAQPKLKDPKLRAIADAMPTALQAEIDRMRGWRDQWFAGAPLSAAASAPSPTDKPTAERQLDTMMPGAAYDALFAATLAAHHEAGIKLGEQALPRLRHKPVRRFARQTLRAQRAEIEVLRARE